MVSFYAALRDKYTPGKAIWLTETAQAGCGGDKCAAQFVDSFRAGRRELRESLVGDIISNQR